MQLHTFIHDEQPALPDDRARQSDDLPLSGGQVAVPSDALPELHPVSIDASTLEPLRTQQRSLQFGRVMIPEWV